MAERTCSIDGCEKPAKCRGWCAGHYTRWYTTGDASGPLKTQNPLAQCLIDGCERLHYARGWCSLHYARWKQHGDPHYINPSRRVRTERRCNVCAETKLITDFYAKNAVCKVCYRERVRARARADRSAHLERKRRWYWKHHAKIRRRQLTKYWADPDAAREAKRQDYAKNGAARRAVHRERLASDPAYRQRYAASKKRVEDKRRAAKAGAASTIIQRAEMDAKVAYWGDRCWVCSGPWCEIDHVKLIAKGGAHLLCNLRPICRSCNASKSTKWPLERITTKGKAA